ncbi:unnamed protein product [Clonostachys rosea]|uniref:ABC transporter domain-containing protein n=1 Tax=Bionectria ochroleuca TaxID=29856 RepID=A0ABY6UEE0_BIOOC|nr:unnamed protein product [Clonostachys rosea]
MNFLDQLPEEKWPQHPFIPREELTGPAFLDTGACLCALQDSPSKDAKNVVWQCIGNQTQGVYKVDTGKWFNALHDSMKIGKAIEDDSNGPETNKTLALVDGKFQEREPNSAQFSVYDRACTGKNHSIFSTAYYRVLEANGTEETPVDILPCWRVGAGPVQIQDVESWSSKGCQDSTPAPFFILWNCVLKIIAGPNNTVNSLPVYCPPVDDCQVSRLLGEVCQIPDTGDYVSMGPFEPRVCQKGYYCPPEANGTEELPCPQGSYCQLGAATPTPCAIGSHCPEMAEFQLFYLPAIILVLVDIILAFAIFVFGYRQRFRQSSSQARIGAFSKGREGMGGVMAKMSGYNALSDDPNDREMQPLDATYISRRPTLGFEAALEPEAGTETDGTEGHKPYETNPQLQAFMDAMRKATEAFDFGLSFRYEDLTFQPKGSPRPILNHVTGSIDRGTLTAVMGGSGGGKSTFVNVLMGKTNHTHGFIAINNKPDKLKRYKKVIGYVPQDDIVLPELTVYENIAHSARVRLPRTWSNRDIDRLVDAVIDCLELSHVCDSLVGSVSKPVISGGQRKRVSIGMELAAAPMAIFLDEPTSGLDASAASSMMRTLKSLAKLGISVIVIIHQPRVETFEMLDNLILLGNGQTIYEGPQETAHEFFENMGFRFPPHTNKADVITDIITGHGREYKPVGDITKEFLIEHWSQYRANLTRDTSRHTLSSAGQGLMHKAIKKRGAYRFKQFWLCLCRAVLQQYRGYWSFWGEMALSLLGGFLLGLAQNSRNGVLFKGTYKTYGMLSTSTDYIAAPQFALLVAIAIGLVSAAPGVKIFSEELLVQNREAEAGHSRVSYFLAKVLCVFPRMVFACLHFSVPLLLLAMPVINWGVAFMANLLYVFCIYGLATIVSMICKREEAPLLSAMLSLILGILSGAAPPLRSVKGWHMEWLWRASPGTWLAEVYFGQLVGPYEYLYNIDTAAGMTGFHLGWLWRNMLILFGIGIGYRVIAFVFLCFGHRLRR